MVDCVVMALVVFLFVVDGTTVVVTVVGNSDVIIFWVELIKVVVGEVVGSGVLEVVGKTILLVVVLAVGSVAKRQERQCHSIGSQLIGGHVRKRGISRGWFIMAQFQKNLHCSCILKRFERFWDVVYPNRE